MYVVVLDVGTSSMRGILADEQGRFLALKQINYCPRYVTDFLHICYLPAVGGYSCGSVGGSVDACRDVAGHQKRRYRETAEGAG